MGMSRSDVQKGDEPFIILVNSSPGWDPLKDTTSLDK